MEGLDHVELFARAHELDGLAGGCADGERCTAAGVAVELGEHHAVDAERLVEGGGGIDRVLTGHRVDHEQDLGRLDGCLYAPQLVHQRLVDVQAACGIEKHDVVAVVAGIFDGFLRNGDRIDLTHLENGDIQLLSDDLQLRDGRGTVHVARGEQRAMSLLTEIARELGDVRRLTGALQADHHHNRRRSGSEGQLGVCTAHERGELLADDLDDLLGRGQTVKHLGADGALGDSLDKVLDDLVAHVCFEKRKAHLPHGELDVLLAQAALAAQMLECGVELFAQSFKCHGTITP